MCGRLWRGGRGEVIPMFCATKRRGLIYNDSVAKAGCANRTYPLKAPLGPQKIVTIHPARDLDVLDCMHVKWRPWLAVSLLPVGRSAPPSRTYIALRPQKEVAYSGQGRGRGERKSEASTADTARKRPERPWTAARTMEVLRRCPLALRSD